MDRRIRRRFDAWFLALEARHLRELEFAEVRRALQALSSCYVGRRAALCAGAALRGRGKRAAFALFYAPLHLLVTLRVTEAVAERAANPKRILDLGCGSGAGAAGWALPLPAPPALIGIDLHPWTVAEARWNWNRLGLRGRAEVGRIERSNLPGKGSAILLAYAVNELDDEARSALLDALVEAVGRGAQLLVLEPIARGVTPWWNDWSQRLERCGGRADEWRFREELPERLELLGRAAGIDTSELTARSLFVAPDPS